MFRSDRGAASVASPLGYLGRVLTLLTMLGTWLLPAPGVLAQATPVPAGYVIHELPTLGGDNGSVVEVNDAGVAVGWSELRPGEDEAHATLWVGGEAIDLGTLGGSGSLAIDINDAGVIVGYAETAAGNARAVTWRDGTIGDLGTLGGDNSVARAINAQGAVVGRADTTAGERHAFVWHNGVMTDLGTLGGPNSDALHMTEAGVVYGTSETASGLPHAARWENGGVTSLGALGGNSAFAMAANASGVVIGHAAPPDGADWALIWRDGIGIPERLDPDDPTASVAVALNDAGDISGSIAASTPEMRAVVWRDGERILLPGFVDDMSGSYSVTNAGLLGGYAANASGQHRPVLWVPASAPTPAALVGASVAVTPAAPATPIAAPAVSPTPAPLPFVWDQVDVTVRLRQDGSFRVTERDRVAFSGGPFRSGYREIPLARIERVDDIRVGEVAASSITPYRFVAPEAFSPDVPHTYTWRVDGPNLRIDWSFPETSSAARTFQIGFNAFGALRVYADADSPYQQISWIGVDVILTATAPVNEASLTFVVPQAMESSQALIQGPGSNRSADHTADGQTWVWRASDLGAGESLTASLRFPPLVSAEAPSWQEAGDRAQATGTEVPGIITPLPFGTPAPQATAVAGAMDAPPCREVMENDFPDKRRELLTDCTTDRAIFVPEAWTFDGGGHTIFARDPDDGRLSGGVVTVSGNASSVRNVTVDGSGLTAPCLVDDGATALAGVLVRGSDADVSGVTVHNLNRTAPVAAGSPGSIGALQSCGAGIAVEGRAAQVFVTENMVENVSLAGIQIDGGTASISHNAIDRVSGAGILAANGANVRVSPGNRVTNSRDGIHFEDRGTGGRIAGNTIVTSTRAGIAVILGARHHRRQHRRGRVLRHRGEWQRHR